MIASRPPSGSVHRVVWGTDAGPQTWDAPESHVQAPGNQPLVAAVFRQDAPSHYPRGSPRGVLNPWGPKTDSGGPSSPLGVQGTAFRFNSRCPAGASGIQHVERRPRYDPRESVTREGHEHIPVSQGPPPPQGPASHAHGTPGLDPTGCTHTCPVVLPPTLHPWPSVRKSPGTSASSQETRPHGGRAFLPSAPPPLHAHVLSARTPRHFQQSLWASCQRPLPSAKVLLRAQA